MSCGWDAAWDTGCPTVGDGGIRTEQLSRWRGGASLPSWRDSLRYRARAGLGRGLPLIHTQVDTAAIVEVDALVLE
jgi:hypothetical protein